MKLIQAISSEGKIYQSALFTDVNERLKAGFTPLMPPDQSSNTLPKGGYSVVTL